MMQNIIDYFGQEVTPENISEDTFDVTVSVSVSNTFFSWVLGFAGDMTIVGPPNATEAYSSLLQQGLDEIKSATLVFPE